MEEEIEKKDSISQLYVKFVLITIIVILVAALGSSALTFWYLTDKPEISLYNSKDEVNNDSSLSTDAKTAGIDKTLGVFRSVIDKYYIGEIDDNKILESTIKGYVAGLDDEYSEYMTKDEWTEFNEVAFGNYVGVGIYLGQDKDGKLVVVSPIKGSPAEEAGVLPGDIIAQVGDEVTTSMTASEASTKIKGEAGTKINIKLIRNDEYIDVELERREIKIYQAEGKMLEDGIGYIQLVTFDEGCSDEIKRAYEDLKNQGAKKIVFDLRNNTGGLVDEALKILDLMLDKEKSVLITKDKAGNEQTTKTTDDMFIDVPIVVLVNEYSASASEIVTGALKDNERVKVVGTKTYGKGVIQNVFPLQDGSVLKLTIAEYFTPNNTKINKIGITPDFEVQMEIGETENDVQLDKALELLRQ